jgi:hypothetical protein
MYNIENKAEFNADKLTFFWNFDGATLGGVQRLGPDWYFIGLREDTWFWFYFKIEGCKNRQIILETKDTRASSDTSIKSPLGGSGFARKPYYSYNNRDFQRFEYAEQDKDEDRRFRYIQTFAKDTVYICFGIPYTPQMMEEFIDEASLHPDVDVFTMGYTRIGLPIRAMTIGTGKVGEKRKGVLLMGREDQEETTAQYAYEGLIRKLLSDEYKALRDEYEFWTVPVVTIDAQKTGAQYSAGFGYATNRWEGNRFIPQYIKIIKNGIDSWKKSGIDLKMAGKFHSPGIWERDSIAYSWESDIGTYMNAGRGRPTYCVSERPDVIEYICRHLENGAMARSKLEVRPVGRFERYIRDAYSMHAVWCVEVAAESVKEAHREGELLLKGISEWLMDNKR